MAQVSKGPGRRKKAKRITAKMMVRLMFVLLAMIVVTAVIVIRLFSYQMKDSSEYQKKVLSQQKYHSSTLYYRRGDILDRKGSYLATSKKIYNLILEPKNILDSKKFKEKDKSYKEYTIDALYKYFPFKTGEVENILKEHPESYYYIAFKKMSYKEVSPYMEFMKTEEGSKIVGVSLEENYARTYPNNSAACQVVGYTSSGNVGNWGLEQQYNDQLNGQNGRTYSYMNSNGEIESETMLPTDGNSIVSTIDLNIQNITDKQLNNFMKKIGAKNASVLVMNPNNGEVLAMSNSRTYDLNHPYDEKVLEQVYKPEEINAMSKDDKINALSEFWRNFIVSDTYEPGSTFKPFTVCAALEEGVIHDGDSYYCGGSMHVGDYNIRCHNTAGDGWIDVEHSIAKSCNVALMQIGKILKKDAFLKYQSVFGFGQYTNIDLPGEATAESLVFNKDTLGETELATATFGQGQNCTMIQLATGFSSLINGGNYYEPHVVKEILGPDGGTVSTIEKKLVKKTISKNTSKLIKRYLKTTVEEGTGVACQIPGYDIGGKTGTAEKGKRNNNKYLISFIGFAPYDNPQLVVYVTIDEINLSPQDQTSYAVKLARQIFKQVLPYMGVEQKEVSKSEANKKIKSVNENGTVSQEPTEQELDEEELQQEESSSTTKDTVTTTQSAADKSDKASAETVTTQKEQVTDKTTVASTEEKE